MTYDFVVTLKNHESKSINTVSFLLAAVSVLFFIVEQLRSEYAIPVFAISVLIIISLLIWNRFNVVKKKRRPRYGLVLLIAGITWFAMPHQPWIGIPLLLMAFLEKQAKFPLAVGFSPDNIVMHTLFKRKFAWNEFNNVLLKDGLLTLDFKNNKLIQRETLDEKETTEAEFNAYCRLQLEKCADVPNIFTNFVDK